MNPADQDSTPADDALLRLERELAELQPTAPSAALRQRLTEQLDADVTSEPATHSLAAAHSRRKLARGVIWSAAGLAAAAVLAAVWLMRDREPLPVPGHAPDHPQIVDVEPPRPGVPRFDPERAPPSLLSYQRALAQSDRALEGLLDRHAGSLLAATPDPLAP